MRPLIYVRSILIFLICIVLNACEDLHGRIRLVEGNFYYTYGMINKAIGAYLDAANEEKIKPYAHFALASTYLGLDQNVAALERLALAEAELVLLPENRPLLYRIRYNSGVALFESGEYEKAAECFRNALGVDSSAWEAKRNLELSLISSHMKNQSTAIQNNEANAIAANTIKQQGDIVFDFIRQKETNKWQSLEWTGEAEDTGPDY